MMVLSNMLEKTQQLKNAMGRQQDALREVQRYVPPTLRVIPSGNNDGVIDDSLEDIHQSLLSTMVQIDALKNFVNNMSKETIRTAGFMGAVADALDAENAQL